ncbi:hypothetical protein P7K49_030343 [Saguinus oedipus]|uniref:Uncharacterized protein n=1 Tax=Saguinus oedipus TaxID=9490 RepID=A0ABQ9U2R0_SAGOE|nr:hypothetical protein P7K49_030343 [Saguinus oedipus]
MRHGPEGPTSAGPSLQFNPRVDPLRTTTPRRPVPGHGAIPRSRARCLLTAVFRRLPGPARFRATGPLTCSALSGVVLSRLLSSGNILSSWDYRSGGGLRVLQRRRRLESNRNQLARHARRSAHA